MSGKPGKAQPTYTADLGLSTESLRRWALQARIAAGKGRTAP